MTVTSDTEYHHELVHVANGIERDRNRQHDQL